VGIAARNRQSPRRNVFLLIVFVPRIDNSSSVKNDAGRTLRVFCEDAAERSAQTYIRFCAGVGPLRAWLRAATRPDQQRYQVNRYRPQGRRAESGTAASAFQLVVHE